VTKFPRRQFLRLAAGAAALPTVSRIARAQAYPSRPVTLILPFAAGGPTDVTARIVGEHMSRTLGQRLIVENVAGAGGTTGSTRAMRASPRRLYDPDRSIGNEIDIRLIGEVRIEHDRGDMRVCLQVGNKFP
jgi:hypothetical protein